jgi:hypothetical protein
MGSKALPRDQVMLVAREGDVTRATDGDADTRWMTGRPQTGDERLDVLVSDLRPLSGVALQLSGWSLNDYPRYLEVEASDDGINYQTVFRGSVLAPLGEALRRHPTRPHVLVTWPPMPARHLRVKQTGSSERWLWSIHELTVYVPKTTLNTDGR